jgi:hypothetical protein
LERKELRMDSKGTWNGFRRKSIDWRRKLMGRDDSISKCRASRTQHALGRYCGIP